MHALGGELPPGVTLDPATGTIAGTPTLAGSFTLRVAAFNVLGASPAQPVAIAVARAPLTITANDKTVAAGAPLPGFDATVAGLVGDDTLATPPTCSAPGAGATPAPGSYPITCAGAVAANYAIDYQPGTLTVTAPAAVPETPPAAPAAPAAATTLTLGTRRIVVIKRNTRNLPVTCTLDQPRLNDCTLTLKAGARTLATGHAVTPPGQAATTVTLSLTKRARKLARRPARPGREAERRRDTDQRPGTQCHDPAPAAAERRRQRPDGRALHPGQRQAPAQRHPIPAPPARARHRRKTDHLHRPYRRPRQHEDQPGTRPATRQGRLPVPHPRHGREAAHPQHRRVPPARPEQDRGRPRPQPLRQRRRPLLSPGAVGGL